jgi:carbonic anhydrase
MLLQALLSLAAVLPTVYACPGHDNHARMPNRKRQEVTDPNATVPQDWAYEASYNWGKINSSRLLTGPAVDLELF